MIDNKEMWEKVKGLKGTREEEHRLIQLKKEGKVSEKDYWYIKSIWMKNRRAK